jgi:hypothetical protein
MSSMLSHALQVELACKAFAYKPAKNVWNGDDDGIDFALFDAGLEFGGGHGVQVQSAM